MLKFKMKKAILAAITAAILCVTSVAATGCQNNSNSSNSGSDNAGAGDASNQQESNSSDALAPPADFVNDSPLECHEDDIKDAINYFNKHAYTSELSFNEAQPNKQSYWVYKELDELRKITLEDNMKIDGDFTVTLGDDMSKIESTDYLFNNQDKEKVETRLNRTTPVNNTWLFNAVDDEGKDIFYVEVQNNSDSEIAADKCKIINMTGAQQCEYMGLRTGDSFRKVLETFGSPNRELFVSATLMNTYEYHMTYIDVENEITLIVRVELNYKASDMEKSTATVSSISVVEGIDTKSAH